MPQTKNLKLCSACRADVPERSGGAAAGFSARMTGSAAGNRRSNSNHPETPRRADALVKF